MFSTFTRLYVGIISGLALTITLFIFMGEEFMRKTEVGIFLEDGAYFVDQYIEQRGTEDSLYKNLTENGKQDFFIFDLTLLHDWDGSAPCHHCELLYHLQGIPVYLVDDTLYAAVFPLPNTSESLVFKEKGDFFSPDIDWDEDSEIIFVVTLIITVILSLGVMVYIPVRKLENQIRHLTATQQQFGAGELSKRVELKDFSAPIRELACGFNTMAEDIERQVRQSVIFTQAIPHEVRTPLSRIQLATDLARRCEGAQQAELHDDIERYVDVVNHLTSDIVMLSRLNSNNHLMNETYELVHLPQWLKHRLHYHNLGAVLLLAEEAKEDPMIGLQPTLGNLVIDNLLQNAKRYGDGKVTVTLRQVEHFWIVDIEDDGPGIPEEKREEIFLPFSRLDKSRNADIKGFGLGLAITTSAARLLHWDLSVGESHLGGARFTVLIPTSD
ncbi:MULTISPECIES: ATP-binding protein [Vibrio harveyi group]|uniref:ATP-binding protein n=1 Tax=Vibrio harveyi group TaxID=717610 RepID=UPI0003A1E3C8|nr:MULTISPECIES: ATP-binding protein [Vibrio harveyi group]PAW08491.1 two-component sensor histidine kinase [Vibrio sp. V1B]